MSNPIYPDITAAEADALSGVVDAATGIRHLLKNANDATTPTHYTRVMQQLAQLMATLGRIGGMVIDLGGLNVGVFACEYRIGATEKSFAGTATQALTASAVNYLYLDADQTLKISTTAWPAGDHLRLAKATTSGSDITALIDARMHNYLIGIVNAWSSVQAGSDVDVNSFALKNVADLRFKDFTELTLAADTITPTQALHRLDTEADAASDNLVTITADAAKIGRLLFLRVENAARVVTVKSTGNIRIKDGDLVLDDVDKFIVLMQHNATQWVELSRNFNSPKTLQQDVDANERSIINVKKLNLKLGSVLQIASGAITPTHSTHKVLAESGVFDDLAEIVGGADGDLLLIERQSTSQITVIDSSEVGGVNIELAVSGRSLLLDEAGKWLLLRNNGGSTWQEIARAAWKLSHLVGTGEVIPWQQTFVRTGTLTDGLLVADLDLSFAMRLRRARGRVVTAPSGGSCVVQIKKNGASVFAADANAINIASAAFTDTSDLIDVSFAVGDRLTIQVATASSAADLGVSLEAYMEATAQP